MSASPVNNNNNSINNNNSPTFRILKGKNRDRLSHTVNSQTDLNLRLHHKPAYHYANVHRSSDRSDRRSGASDDPDDSILSDGKPHKLGKSVTFDFVDRRVSMLSTSSSYRSLWDRVNHTEVSAENDPKRTENRKEYDAKENGQYGEDAVRREETEAGKKCISSREANSVHYINNNNNNNNNNEHPQKAPSLTQLELMAIADRQKQQIILQKHQLYDITGKIAKLKDSQEVSSNVYGSGSHTLFHDFGIHEQDRLLLQEFQRRTCVIYDRVRSSWSRLDYLKMELLALKKEEKDLQFVLGELMGFVNSAQQQHKSQCLNEAKVLELLQMISRFASFSTKNATMEKFLTIHQQLHARLFELKNPQTAVFSNPNTLHRVVVKATTTSAPPPSHLTVRSANYYAPPAPPPPPPPPPPLWGGSGSARLRESQRSTMTNNQTKMVRRVKGINYASNAEIRDTYLKAERRSHLIKKFQESAEAQFTYQVRKSSQPPKSQSHLEVFKEDHNLNKIPSPALGDGKEVPKTTVTERLSTKSPVTVELSTSSDSIDHQPTAVCNSITVTLAPLPSTVIDLEDENSAANNNNAASKDPSEAPSTTVPSSPVAEETLTNTPSSPNSDTLRKQAGHLGRSSLKRDSPKRSGLKVVIDPLTFLLDASSKEDLEDVKKICLQMPDVSLRGEDDITALHNAICSDNEAISRFLITECAADVNAQEIDGWTPLHCAAVCLNFPLCQLLVTAGASLGMMTFYDYKTPIEKCQEAALSPAVSMKQIPETKGKEAEGECPPEVPTSGAVSSNASKSDSEDGDNPNTSEGDDNNDDVDDDDDDTNESIIAISKGTVCENYLLNEHKMLWSRQCEKLYSVFNYSARHEDELDLVRNQEIKFLADVDTDPLWFRGECIQSRRQGLVPRAFVSRYPLIVKRTWPLRTEC